MEVKIFFILIEDFNGDIVKKFATHMGDPSNMIVMIGDDEFEHLN
jgi:hypothetical protein